MSTGELEGRVALVTGAGRGILINNAAVVWPLGPSASIALHERFIAMHESGSLTTPEQSASALLEHLRTGGSGQIWDVA